MYRISEFLVRCITPIIIQFAILLLFGSLITGEQNAGLATTLAAITMLPIWYLLWKQDRIRRSAVSAVNGLAKEQAQAPAAWKGKKLLIGAAFAAIAGAVLSYGAGYLMEALGFYERFSNEAQEQLLTAPSIVQVIGLGILVPIAEEWLYRGILFERVKEWLPVWAAVLITGGAFALGHGNVIQIVYAFPMGILLALLYVKSGTLFIPMAFHIGANMITVLLT